MEEINEIQKLINELAKDKLSSDISRNYEGFLSEMTIGEIKEWISKLEAKSTQLSYPIGTAVSNNWGGIKDLMYANNIKEYIKRESETFFSVAEPLMKAYRNKDV